jgi:hypothetical protein
MPADKDFKRVVRARMHKTGESYTAVRANLLKTAPATAPVPAARKPDYARLAGLYRAFADPRERRAWRPVARASVLSATRNKVVRLAWPDGTRVEARFHSQGTGKAMVQLEQGPFADKAGAERLRLFWSGRLGALAERTPDGPVRRPQRPPRAKLRQPAQPRLSGRGAV